jgi:hypothetical protein
MVKYYTIVFPGEFGQHVQETWSSDQIIESYYKYWAVKMIDAGKSDDISRERCIEDWIVIHWAQETDEFGEIKTLEQIIHGATLMSDKGYAESTHEKQAEFAKKRNYESK